MTDPRRPPADVTDLSDLRAQIDAIDDTLLTLLAERQAHADRAAELKVGTGISAAAPTRFAAVLDTVAQRAEAKGFDPELARQMWRLMIETFIRREERTLGTEGEDA